MAFRYLWFQLIRAETECRSEGQSNPHSQADVIYCYPKADAESEADASATRNPPPRCL